MVERGRLGWQQVLRGTQSRADIVPSSVPRVKEANGSVYLLTRARPSNPHASRYFSSSNPQPDCAPNG